jgi:hypothetical protein
LLAVGVSLPAPNIPGLLSEIFLEIMQHIQNVGILLMMGKQTTAPNEVGQQLGFNHITPMFSMV